MQLDAKGIVLRIYAQTVASDVNAIEHHCFHRQRVIIMIARQTIVRVKKRVQVLLTNFVLGALNESFSDDRRRRIAPIQTEGLQVRHT
jgi:hypothetical protein